MWYLGERDRWPSQRPDQLRHGLQPQAWPSVDRRQPALGKNYRTCMDSTWLSQTKHRSAGFLSTSKLTAPKPQKFKSLRGLPMSYHPTQITHADSGLSLLQTAPPLSRSTFTDWGDDWHNIQQQEMHLFISEHRWVETGRSDTGRSDREWYLCGPKWEMNRISRMNKMSNNWFHGRSEERSIFLGLSCQSRTTFKESQAKQSMVWENNLIYVFKAPWCCKTVKASVVRPFSREWATREHPAWEELISGLEKCEIGACSGAGRRNLHPHSNFHYSFGWSFAYPRSPEAYHPLCLESF